MSEFPLRDRTQAMALRVMNVYSALPLYGVAQVLGYQMLRSGPSVGANYRASMRAKSRADMINKLKIVEEEADETLYWLELLVKGNIMPEPRLRPLMNEVEEIIAMTVSSIKTLRGNAES